MKAAKEHKPQQSRVIQNQQRVHNHFRFSSNIDFTPIKSPNIIQCAINLSSLLDTLGLMQRTANISEFYNGAHCYFPQGTYQQLNKKFSNDSITRVSSHYRDVNKEEYPDRQIMIKADFATINMPKDSEFPFLYGFLPTKKMTWGQMEGAPFRGIGDLIPHGLTTFQHFRFGLAPLGILNYLNIGPNSSTSIYSEKNKKILKLLPVNKKRKDSRLKKEDL